MKTKFTKQSRNLLIAMLIGDGTISNNYVFKMAHCVEQQEYLLWKIKQLSSLGIRNNGLKKYVKTSGYTTGVEVVYTQLNIIPFVKLLRRICYKPTQKKNYYNIKLLNRLDALGLSIWYMDDGHININAGRIYVKLATCTTKENNQVLIDYFKSKWGINFYTFKEGKETFSICCGTAEAKKFISIVKPYILEIPSMWYKVRNNMTKAEFQSALVGLSQAEMCRFEQENLLK